MDNRFAGLVGALIALTCVAPASAYYHANYYGGSTSHSYDTTSHSNYAGGHTTYTYGQGATHTNTYGGSTSHSYYGGTSHSNVYGGTTSGAYGAGAYHTNPYGQTSYASAYHPPTAYYGYHPPTTVPYYGSGCYNCDGSAWGAAAAGAAVGATAATAAARYNVGETVVVLPSGCSSSSVGSTTYYNCGGTYFTPAYGANGVTYTVVTAP